MTLRSILAGRSSAALRQSRIRIPFIGKIEEKAVKTHLLCAIALGLAGTATAASAQDSDTFQINSNVTPFCANLGAPSGPLDLGALTEGEGILVTAFVGDTDYTVTGYYCNSPASVTLAAAPLMQQGAPAPSDPGFTNRIDYLASLSWASLTGDNDSATNTPTVIPNTSPRIGDLVITVSDPETVGTTRPIAGDYAGAVTLTIVAQP